MAQDDTDELRIRRKRVAEHLAAFYGKPLFWHRAYYAGSVGGASLETVKAYVEAQGTEEHAAKSKARKSRSPA